MVRNQLIDELLAEYASDQHLTAVLREIQKIDEDEF